MNKVGFLVGLCLFASGCEFNLDTSKVAEALGTVEPTGVKFEESLDAFQATNASQKNIVLENGIEVMLISDSNFSQSSAALSIPVGSMSDPREHQGIAHFTEHLLFLGTSKYPSVGEYKDYMNKNGGYANAYTSYDETNYQFQISNEAFPEGLDRFSRFFIDPLFDANYVEKERNAVNNEFTKNFQLSGWRANHLMGQLAPEDHIFHTFRVGNNESLKTTTRDQVVDFYNKYYSANLMKLVVMGPQSHDELEALVRKSFVDVKNKNLKAPNYVSSQHSMKTGELINYKALTPEKELTLFFPVPVFKAHPQSKPGHIVGALLNYKGENSLYESLKKKGLITNLSGGAYDIANESSIYVSFETTEKGAAQSAEIIAEFFAAMEALKVEFPTSPIYKNAIDIQNIAFQYKNLQEGADQAAKYASAMHEYPALKIDEINEVIKQERKDLVAKYLDLINTKNMTVYYSTQNVPTNMKEPYFGVEYSRQAIPEALLAKVGQASSMVYRGPGDNPYIAKDLAIKKSDATEKAYRLTETEGGKVWFQQESKSYAQPKSYISYRIKSPEFEKDVKSSTLASFFVAVVQQKLRASNSDILEALNDFKLSIIANGLNLEVMSFSDQGLKILKDLLSQLQTVELTEEDLSGSKESIKTALATKRKGMAYEQSQERLTEMLESDFTLEEQEALIDTLTLKDLKDFQANAFKRIYVESLVYGNLEASEAKSLVDYGFDILKAQKLNNAEKEAIKKFNRRMPEGKQLVYSFQGENNNNAFVKAYYTGLRTTKKSVLGQAMGLLMSASYYKAMRTDAQYGYIVGDSMNLRAVESSYNFIIQSGTHQLDEIVRESDKFVMNHLTEVKPQVEEAMPFIKQSLERTTVQNDVNMEDAYKRLSNYIFDRGENPNYREDLVKEIKALTAKDVTDYIDTYFLSSNKSTVNVIHVGTGFKPMTLLPEESAISGLKDFEKIAPKSR